MISFNLLKAENGSNIAIVSWSDVVSTFTISFFKLPSLAPYITFHCILV